MLILSFRLGSDPQEVFPRSAFDDQLIKFGRYGLFMSVITMPAVTVEKDEILDTDALSEQLNEMNVSESSAMHMKTSSRYRERMMGVLEDMLELGYI